MKLDVEYLEFMWPMRQMKPPHSPADPQKVVKGAAHPVILIWERMILNTRKVALLGRAPCMHGGFPVREMMNEFNLYSFSLKMVVYLLMKCDIVKTDMMSAYTLAALLPCIASPEDSG